MKLLESSHFYHVTGSVMLPRPQLSEAKAMTLKGQDHDPQSQGHKPQGHSQSLS